MTSVQHGHGASFTLWTADTADPAEGGILLTLSQLREWTGLDMTDEELSMLADCMPGLAHHIEIMAAEVWRELHREDTQ
jgi:hypothetical protein